MKDDAQIDPTAMAVDDAIQAAARPKLGPGRIGASLIGEDARTIWLSWRWCLPQDATPRLRRIWRLGDLIERELLRLLAEAGLEVHATDTAGEQFGYKALAGHYALRIDGVVGRVPNAPRTWHLLELKSMSAKYHRQVAREGVQAAQPKHYHQVQAGMHHAGLQRALYVAYCKDTSALYFERVAAVSALGAGLVTKAQDVIERETPPVPGKGEDWRLKARSEAWRAVYLGLQLPPSANCRNCRFSRPELTGAAGDAAWVCDRYGLVLDRQAQSQGCGDHNWLPALVDAAYVCQDDAQASVTYERDGVEFQNVPASAKGLRAYHSAELAAISRGGYALIADELAEAIRDEFGATVTTVVAPDGSAPF